MTVEMMTEAEFRDERLHMKVAGIKPTVDMVLLRKTLETIDANPENWDQDDWGDFQQLRDLSFQCDTPRCVAGWACSLGEGPYVMTDYNGRLKTPVLSVELTAQRLLGLTDEEACVLFDSAQCSTKDKERQRIQEVAEEIAERAGDTL